MGVPARLLIVAAGGMPILQDGVLVAALGVGGARTSRTTTACGSALPRCKEGSWSD
jgi:uncharacterized protein GlcG (DUF336 family)